MGGNPIWAAVEHVPAPITRLANVAAVLPIPGDPPGLVGERIFATPNSHFIGTTVPGPEDGTTVISAAGARAAFYNTRPPSAAERALARLRPQLTGVIGTPIPLSGANCGRVPKRYVLCLCGQAIPARIQRRMCGRVPEIAVVEMDCDHSPFYSDPQGLARVLVSDR